MSKLVYTPDEHYNINHNPEIIKICVERESADIVCKTLLGGGGGGYVVSISFFQISCRLFKILWLHVCFIIRSSIHLPDQTNELSWE